MDGESGGDGAGRPGKWNETIRKENSQDAADAMKQEVYCVRMDLSIVHGTHCRYVVEVAVVFIDNFIHLIR